MRYWGLLLRFWCIGFTQESISHLGVSRITGCTRGRTRTRRTWCPNRRWWRAFFSNRWFRPWSQSSCSPYVLLYIMNMSYYVRFVICAHNLAFFWYGFVWVRAWDDELPCVLAMFFFYLNFWITQVSSQLTRTLSNPGIQSHRPLGVFGYVIGNSLWTICVCVVTS